MRRVLAAGAASLVASMIAFAPLSLARGVLEARVPGLAVETMEGTLWSGTLLNASYGGHALGDIGVRTSLVRLLSGATHLELSGAVRGHLRVNGTRFALHAQRLDVPPRIAGLAPIVRSPLQFTGLDLVMQGGRCSEASGTIQAVAQLGERPVALTGAVACEQGRVTARVEGVDVSGSSTLSAGGAITTELNVTGLDETAMVQLAALGFDVGEGRASVTRRGTLIQP